MRLEGITTGNNKVNRDGIGSKLEVKVGDLYQLQYVSEQGLPFGWARLTRRILFGLSGQTVVPQNCHRTASEATDLEKQILKGSCPFLYVYDGEKYEFVTDLLCAHLWGLSRQWGSSAPDETRDFVKISGTQIQPKGGKYSIQITEELWETAYF